MNFRIGDLVSRISYKHDVVFKIVGFEGKTVFLKGVDLRLIADCEVDDLVKVSEIADEDEKIIEANVRDINIDRSQYFYLPGKILHIDADIHLSNTLANPYKIRELAKIENATNHQKMKKSSKI